MNSNLLVYIASALVVLYTAGPAHAKQPPPDPVMSSLKPIKSQFFDEFLLAANARLSGYSKIYIDQPSVAFDKYWLRDHRSDIPQSYKQQVIERYARLLKEALKNEFEKSDRFTIVENKAKDVLVISPKIIDLNIYGPDWGFHVKTFVFHAGSATFDVDLATAEGDILAKFKDRRETRGRGFLRPERTSRVQNQRDFRLLMEKWSRHMVNNVAMN